MKRHEVYTEYRNTPPISNKIHKTIKIRLCNLT